jgi:hypothetical protein
MIYALFPNCEIGEDSDGQIVIHTNLQEKGDEWVEWEEKKDPPSLPPLDIEGISLSLTVSPKRKESQ